MRSIVPVSRRYQASALDGDAGSCGGYDSPRLPAPTRDVDIDAEGTRRPTRKIDMVMAVLGVGSKVRVLGGPFAGRVGVISELDGKGGARVTLGIMSARVLLEDLRSDRHGASDGRTRPALQSSHRRPEQESPTDVRSAPARSKKTRTPRRNPPK